MAKSISQLNTIAQAHDSDLFEVAAVDAQSSSGYTSGKMSAEVLAEGMLSTFTYPTAMPDMQNKTITGALNQLLANFAPAYDDTETYAEGDVVTYQGQLYKCETAVSTAETFDPTKWAAIVVTELSGGHNYSTSEHVVGTWIDGKPVYEKTIYCGDGGISTTVNVPHNILGLKRVIKLFGCSEDGEPVPTVNGGSDFIRLSANTQYIELKYRDSWEAHTSIYVTIQYTKTTDY